MSDSINRSAAIHAVCVFTVLRYHASPEDLDAIGAVLNALPSAQPERLTDDDFETIRIHLNAGYRGTWKYCPNCGAEMR